MITCSGTGGGPGWGSAGIRFTSNFGGGACGPVSCARKDIAEKASTAKLAVAKPPKSRVSFGIPDGFFVLRCRVRPAWSTLTHFDFGGPGLRLYQSRSFSLIAKK